MKKLLYLLCILPLVTLGQLNPGTLSRVPIRATVLGVNFPAGNLVSTGDSSKLFLSMEGVTNSESITTAPAKFKEISSKWYRQGGVLSPEILTDKVSIGDRAAADQLQITNNFRLPVTTGETVGVIKKAADWFIHDYGLYNTFLGINAGNFSLTGTANTGIGESTLYKNAGGYDNTAVGYKALYSNTGGFANTAFGATALYTNTSGTYNTGLGNHSLENNTTGSGNIGVGDNALYYNSTGTRNTAIGYRAAWGNSTGSYNSVVGNNSFVNSTTGSYNSVVGNEAMYYTNTGRDNVAMGHRALYSNTVGFRNVAIGDSAFYDGTNYSNSIAIGFRAQPSTSNQAVFGNTDITSTILRGTINAAGTPDGTASKAIGIDANGNYIKYTAAGAQIQSDWNQTNNGSVDYIKNKPTIPAAQIQSDWNQTNNSSLDYIKNKPSIPAAEAYFGTVTSIATSAPIIGGTITGSGTIGISSFSGSTPGAVPTSSGGTTKYLRADGQWETPPGTYTHPAKGWADKVDLTGDTVISNLTIDASGHPTNWTKRKLTIPAAQIQSDWNQSNSGALDYIKNKPTIITADSNLWYYKASRNSYYPKYIDSRLSLGSNATSANTNRKLHVDGSQYIRDTLYIGTAPLSSFDDDLFSGYTFDAPDIYTDWLYVRNGMSIGSRKITEPLLLAVNDLDVLGAYDSSAVLSSKGNLALGTNTAQTERLYVNGRAKITDLPSRANIPTHGIADSAGMLVKYPWPTLSGNYVTSVGASSPLESSGGTTPSISFKADSLSVWYTKMNQGATAYGWGNHASQGYHTGNGTSGKIAKYTGTSTLGSSIMTEYTGRVDVDGTLSISTVYKFPTGGGSANDVMVYPASGSSPVALTWGKPWQSEGYVTGTPWRSEGYILDGNTGWDNSYGFITAAEADTGLFDRDGSGRITPKVEDDTIKGNLSTSFIRFNNPSLSRIVNEFYDNGSLSDYHSIMSAPAGSGTFALVNWASPGTDTSEVDLVLSDTKKLYIDIKHNGDYTGRFLFDENGFYPENEYTGTITATLGKSTRRWADSYLSALHLTPTVESGEADSAWTKESPTSDKMVYKKVKQGISGTVTVSQGGTGVTSLTPYGIMIGGTTTTGTVQSVGTGSDGQHLRSNGSSAAPSWEYPVVRGTFCDLLTANTTDSIARFDISGGFIGGAIKYTVVVVAQGEGGTVYQVLTATANYSGRNDSEGFGMTFNVDTEIKNLASGTLTVDWNTDKWGDNITLICTASTSLESDNIYIYYNFIPNIGQPEIINPSGCD